MFEIKDGTNRSGRLDSTTADYYYINNPAIGVDRISKKNVSKIKEIHLNKDGTFSNPHYSRYLFGPSALPQTKGELYWNNVSFEYNTIQFGVTENLSMGVGGFLFTSLSGNLVLLPNVKYSFKITIKIFNKTKKSKSFLRACFFYISKRKLYYSPKACFKSAIRSSMFSIPTLNRKSDSTTPALSRSSFGMEA